MHGADLRRDPRLRSPMQQDDRGRSGRRRATLPREPSSRRAGAAAAQRIPDGGVHSRPTLTPWVAAVNRTAGLKAQMHEALQAWSQRPTTEALMSLWGISTITAMNHPS